MDDPPTRLPKVYFHVLPRISHMTMDDPWSTLSSPELVNLLLFEALSLQLFFCLVFSLLATRGLITSGLTHLTPDHSL